MADTKKKPAKKKAVKKVIKKPPSLPIKSVQHDLFREFLSNDPEEVSNTVELWERIPKYFLSPEEQKKLRGSNGLAQPYVYSYVLRDKNGAPLPFKVKIQPALIEQPYGNHIAFFPSSAEEIIEEVLKKIFTEQNLGIHDVRNAESWVRFSYGMINKELRKNHCSKTHQQIKHSLEIISKCIITAYEDDEEIYTGAILQDYCSVDRKKYLDDSKALHVARLPVFISHAVNTLQYRQFNYKRMMRLKSALSREILRRMINRFIQASLIRTYHFRFSTIQEETPYLRAVKQSKNREKFISALNELVKEGAIYNYEIEKSKEGNKITDIKYVLSPTQEFCSEQKASNARANIIEDKAKLEGLGIVDKSKAR